jgi:hypothetical protein
MWFIQGFNIKAIENGVSDSKKFLILAIFLFFRSSGIFAQNVYGPLNQPNTWTAQQSFSAGITGYQIIPVGYQVTANSGLVVNIASGTAICSGTFVSYAGGTLTLAANSTNYVYLNTSSSCAPASNTSGVGSNILLAIVSTGSRTITSITDARTLFVGSNFANPMTTLGDLLYGGASGAPTRLAGKHPLPRCSLNQ